MNSKYIKEAAQSLGADLCGIGGIERIKEAPEGFHPLDVFKGTNSIIVFAMESPKGLFEVETNVPYTMIKNKLADKLNEISMAIVRELDKEGYTAIPIPADEPYEYWDQERMEGRGILSLKHLAVAAGMGTIGRNTLLINKTYGNRLYLGAVLTDAVLEEDPLAEKLCIEGCSKCIDACPGKALTSEGIKQIKCRKVCGHSTPGGGFVYACNVCRKSCPFARI